MYQSTHERYRRIAAQFADKYRQQTGWDWRDDPITYVEWVIADLSSSDNQFQPATVRIYRAAVTDHMRREGPLEAVEMLSRATHLVPSKRQMRRRPRTSAKKRTRSVTTEDMHELLDQLQQSRSSYRIHAMMWISATAWTGLRPSEWRTARIHNGVLIVHNAKLSEERAHGRFRHLLIEQMPEQRRRLIERFVSDILNDYRDPQAFHRLFEGTRRLIQRAGKKRWPRRRYTLSLYSFRHLFASYAKSFYAGSPEVVAALMGHANDRTAFHHYKRQGRGDGPDTAAPVFVGFSARDVARVRQTHSLEQLEKFKQEQSTTSAGGDSAPADSA